MSSPETMGDHRSIRLPKHVLTQVDSRLQYTEFDTATEYITYALEELLAQVHEASDDEYEAGTKREIESRLRSLGYLDD